MERVNKKVGDRLSSLPDLALQHVLSFLDIRDCVKTCILSKRWRLVWVSLPTLNFHELAADPDDVSFQEYRINSDFSQFVDNVFIHRAASSIQRFRLLNASDLHRVYSWVLAATRHSLQELDLEMFTRSRLYLPLCVYTCASLTMLKLKFQGTKVSLKLPDYVNLPCLKTLHLTSVCFVDANACNKLFSSCPVLESLLLWEFRLEFPMRENLRIFISTLEHLKIETYFDKLFLYTPNLRSLTLKGNLTGDYMLGDLSSLVYADIDVNAGDISYYDDLFEEIFAEMKVKYVVSMVAFLQLISNVRALSLSAWSIEILSEPDSILGLSTQFPNLRHMKLQTFLSSEYIHRITRLLDVSPKVESLILEVTEWKQLQPPSPSLCLDETKDTSINSGEGSEAGLLLGCMFLKAVEILGFTGSVNELKILEILLKSVVALEKLVIFTAKEPWPDREQRLISCSKKLLGFARPSSKISILIL